MRKLTPFATILAIVALTGTADASLIISTSNQIGNGTTPFTPTYTPLNNDLINGLTPFSSTGNFALETSSGLPSLTDGLYPALNTGGMGAHPGLSTAGNGAGTQVTYVFATNDVARVDMYGGWNDSGRDQQNFTMQFSTDGGATFGTAIPSGSFNPTIGANLQSATLVSISDNAGPLALGVNAIRINFLTVENTYTGYAELDVVAVATVPEPSTLLLGVLASLGLFGFARFRRR